MRAVPAFTLDKVLYCILHGIQSPGLYPAIRMENAEQVDTIDQQGARVSNEMQTVSAATEEQSASAAEIATASNSLSKLATDLQVSLNQFKF